MRILHLTSTFPREPGGAGGSFLEDLARAQAAAGHDVTVIAPHDAGLPVAEEWGTITICRFRYAPDRWETLAYRGGLIGTTRGLRGVLMVPLFIWGMFNAVLAASKEQEVDVVHAHWWLPAGLAAVFAARRLRAPLVITCHGSDVALAGRRPAVGALARWVLRRATTVATVSESLQTEVKNLAGIDPTVLRMPAELPAGPQLRAPSGGERHRATEVGLKVVAAGRLSREKGFDVLIEALALVPGISAEIVGDGPELQNLESCAKRLNVDHRLRFSPALPRTEYLDRLAGADAVIVPSRHEGLGLVAAEALALGRPVICSDVGGLPEVVGTAVSSGAACLVRPEDPSALAAALRELPLPSPTAEATAALVERHRPEVVAAAHQAAYSAAGTTAQAEPVRKRRRPLRWLGAAAGLFLLFALVSAVTEDLSDLREAVQSPRVGWLVAAGALALLAELGFAIASGVVGRSLIRPAPSLAQTAATYLVAQQAKHVPGGIWPAVARAGLSRRLGLNAGLAFVWVLAESLASVAAGLVLGGAVLLAADQAGLRGRLWAGIALAAGLVGLALFAVARQTLLGRVLDAAGRIAGHETPSLTRLAAVHLPAWLATGATTAALTAALVTTTTPNAYRTVAAAAILASVAGFLALPIPAGIGVREAVFVALTATVLTGAQALVVALAARLISLGAQVLLAGLACGQIPKNISEPGNDSRIVSVDQIPADESG